MGRKFGWLEKKYNMRRHEFMKKTEKLGLSGARAIRIGVGRNDIHTA